jgi:hypothetical protein
MNETEKPKSKESQLVRICSLVFMIAGIGVYEMAAQSIFGDPAEHGFSFIRLLGAGVVGGVSATIGYGAGKLFEKIRG